MKMEKRNTRDALKEICKGIDRDKESLIVIYQDWESGWRSIGMIGQKRELVAMLGAAIEEEAKEDEEGVMVRAITLADIISDGKLVELVKAIEREKAQLSIKEDKQPAEVESPS